MVVGFPYSLIFWQFCLFLVFKLVVILLLVVWGSEAYLPTPPSWPEAHKPLLTRPISHSTFSMYNANLFLHFSHVFTFLKIIKHNTLKKLLIYSIFNIKMATQKFINCFFKCTLLWQLSQYNLTKLFQMKLKTTECLLEPSYGKKPNELFAQPSPMWVWKHHTRWCVIYVCSSVWFSEVGRHKFCWEQFLLLFHCRRKLVTIPKRKLLLG